MDQKIVEVCKNKEFSRRSFFKIGGTFMLALGMPITFMKDAYAENTNLSLGATVSPDHITLTWMENSKTTQTVSWRTNTDVFSGKIQYGVGNLLDNAKTEEAQTTTLITDLGEMNVHSVTLSGLNSGTKYTYRVGNGEVWSENKNFITEPAKRGKFKFLVFGDSQSGMPDNPEYGPWHTTIQNAHKANSDAAFFMNVGDLVEVGQSYEHWNEWFKGASGVSDHIPSMSVLGNHETYCPPDKHSTRPLFFTSQSKLPQNGPDALKGQVYSFDYGEVHLVVLDSQIDEEGSLVDNMLVLEQEWLENDLKSTDKKWKLVFFHKTPYYNKATRTNEKIKAALVPIIDKYHADVVFNGHDHGYSRTYPIYNDSFVASPSQGTVYVVTGRSGIKYYSDLSQKVWDAFFYDPQEEPNYLVVEVDGEVLTIKAYTQRGKLVDTYQINKATGKDTPLTALPDRYEDTRLVIYGNLIEPPLVPQYKLPIANTEGGKWNADLYESLPEYPHQIDNVWYVPLRTFFVYIEGDFNQYDLNDSKKIEVKYNNKTIQLLIDDKQAVINGESIELQHPVVAPHHSVMIAADDLKTLSGFVYKYDANINLLMFTR